MSNNDILSSLWVEKFRPKTLNDLVLPDRYKTDFQQIIVKCSLPNLLFSVV